MAATLAEVLHKARPGRLDRLEIHEISGVDKPACEHCLAKILKSSDGGEDDLDLTPADRGALDLFERGAAIRKATERQPDPRPDLAPGEKIDWAATAKVGHAELDRRARATATKDGLSYSVAYVKEMEAEPEGSLRVIRA